MSPGGFSLVDSVGSTPLIRLNRVSDSTGCEILGKAEFMNPGGSVKDRAALGIVRDAEKRGQLRAGGTVVEGTAGNTGIGLAVVNNALGYRTVIVMPANQSRDKIDTLRAYGAEVRLVKPAPYKDPNHFVHQSRRLAETLADTEANGAIWANQFDNVANRAVHEQTTGGEIWDQTGGRVDGFVCAAGTGGTLAGVARTLRRHKPDVCIGLSDPGGSALYQFFAHGELKAQGNSITEGIGNSRITDNLADTLIDMPMQIPDADAIPMVYEMIRQEGLCLGGSSGINVCGAVNMARELGPGHTIVTILCDGGMRYKERLFNPNYLAEHDLALPDWLDLGD